MALWNDLLDQRKDFPFQFISELAGTSQMSDCSFGNLLRNLFHFPTSRLFDGITQRSPMCCAGHAGPLGSGASSLRMIRDIRHPETHFTLTDACLGRRLIYSLKVCLLHCHWCSAKLLSVASPIYLVCLHDMFNMVIEVISVQFSYLPIFQIKVFASEMEKTVWCAWSYFYCVVWKFTLVCVLLCSWVFFFELLCTWESTL